MSPKTVDRFLTALPRGGRQVYLSWRLLKSDLLQEPFHVQRRRDGASWTTVSNAITTSTDYLDTAPDLASFQYRIVSTQDQSKPVSVDAAAPATNLAFEFSLQDVPQHYPLRMAVGDLCNDGRYGVIVTESLGKRIWVCAYTLEGKLLWKHDTGLPDHGGWDGRMHHVPIAAWDVNQDGRTEVIFHRGPGVAFPDDFYAEAGPDETIVAVDGESGEIIWEAPWPATRPRVMFTIGYLHGMDEAASIVVQDGTYGNETLTAIDGRTGKTQWQVHQPRPAGHNLDIDDITGDGRMEVIAGGICYSGDGARLWEAEAFGHTDVSKPAHYLPERPGKQILYLVEKNNPGVYMVDANGATLWNVPFGHAHWSWIGRYPVGGDQLMIHAAEKGEREYFPIFYPDGREWLELTRHQAHRFAAVGWSADGFICFAHRKEHRIYTLDSEGNQVAIPDSELPAGALFGRHQVAVDLIGDYRENFGAIDYEKGTFFVAQNPLPAGHRALSPIEDFTYRHERNQLGSGYYTYIAPPPVK
jgi:hypothetical protein